jgi:hypothetical protein
MSTAVCPRLTYRKLRVMSFPSLNTLGLAPILADIARVMFGPMP